MGVTYHATETAPADNRPPRRSDYEPSADATHHFGLTPRELDVVAALRLGESNRAIARRLALAEDTVKHHLTSVFGKTGVRSRLELAVLAMQYRLGDDAVALHMLTNER
jgi:DNA-binding NarL/FixJ family response regulator